MVIALLGRRVPALRAAGQLISVAKLARRRVPGHDIGDANRPIGGTSGKSINCDIANTTANPPTNAEAEFIIWRSIDASVQRSYRMPAENGHGHLIETVR
jgi:hypothetical protein